MNEYILYILMRNDLPSLNPGKAMAHSTHAGNVFTFHHGQLDSVRVWMGDRGFGTTICLAANREEIVTKLAAARARKCPCGESVDPTYPYMVSNEIASLINPEFHTADPVVKGNNTMLFRNEMTAAYIFVEVDSPLNDALTSDLPLHP